ncbi:transposon ty3-g Gag-Pol polyprotein [Plakobranchus ocellatus]|uniref:Transposon ty3-g Gag-Pol polyprotein n=1 Tax=Plakobranchus ocellatus TaxID=259542 RepID=A0AAV3YY81_9GAST|nr:transposon ty3-g Gag-Pol polyprotein [Plakobranchus ocellatus]
MSQPQGESTQALLAALTIQLQSMTVQPNISAVSLKLPEFWTTSPEVWFARVEAQFGTKNISTDQTKYDYVVSALDVKTAEEVQDVLVNPPDANKYSVLKRALLKAFGKSSSLPTWVQIFVLAAFGKRQCQPLSVAAAGNPHQPNTFSVVDRLSGHSYLVDTGAEVSVYPASVQERKSQPPSSTLTAANGTSIHTWGKRKVFLAIGQKGQYQHEFYLADVTRPILGADFFIKHGLAIDLRGKRLLSLDNISILLRETRSPLILSSLGFPLKHEYDSLLQQFPELLTPHFHQCNNKHGVEHHIITQGPPTHSRARRLDQAKLSATKAEFLQMEDMGIIRRSKSAWSSPLHMVPKADGNWRPGGDYRRLNASTDDDRYPLPHIQDFNNHLAGCKVFSKIDLIRGYHQIPMAPSSIAKTAVVTPFGLWEFLRMPFGLKNAAQSFQRLMDGILRDIPFAFVYLDDILVASRSSQEHAQHLEQLFKLLSANGLVINKAKCIFGAEELDFLGYHVSAIGIAPLPDRVAALRDSKPPQNRTGLQRFTGMINYYHRFLPGLAPILAPLHAQASGKGQSMEWSAECQASFDEVKEILARSVLLNHPLPDAPTSLTFDALSTAVGAQLEQRQGQSWVPLAFFSRKLSDAEKKYSAFDRELLASYSAVKHFRHFLEGRPFTLYTDHKPLTFALSSENDRSPRQTRHLAFIAEFTTDIRHIKGKFNVVADALSRITTTSNAADTINLCPVSTSHPVEVDWTDFAQLAKDQIQSGEMASYRTATTGLILKDIDIGPSTLFCDTSLGVTRPVLPVSWTRPVFNKIHGLSHPGVSHNDSYGTLNSLLGINANTTTAYHPQANGMVERLHRQLKASLKARTTSSNWFDELPMVLLGIRSSWRVDPGCSPAELVYGSTLRIPGEFLQPHDARTVEPDLPFLRHLQQTMRSVQPPTPQFHGQPSVYVPANLVPAKFVHVRKDSHKHPLQRPYDGSYLVLNKSDKFFTVDIKGRPETISIDRLKAAFVTQLTTAGDTDRPPEPPSAEPQANSPPQPFLPTSSPSMDTLVTKTRSGRSIRLPSRFR